MTPILTAHQTSEHLATAAEFLSPTGRELYCDWLCLSAPPDRGRPATLELGLVVPDTKTKEALHGITVHGLRIMPRFVTRPGLKPYDGPEKHSSADVPRAIGATILTVGLPVTAVGARYLNGHSVTADIAIWVDAVCGPEDLAAITQSLTGGRSAATTHMGVYKIPSTVISDTGRGHTFSIQYGLNTDRSKDFRTSLPRS